MQDSSINKLSPTPFSSFNIHSSSWISDLFSLFISLTLCLF